MQKHVKSAYPRLIKYVAFLVYDEIKCTYLFAGVLKFRCSENRGRAFEKSVGQV